MRKELINKYLRKLGVEVHGTGYIKKLLSTQTAKNSFQTQAQLVAHTAPVIFDIGANKGLTTKQYLQYFPLAEIHAFEPFPEHFSLWDDITGVNKKVHFNPLGVSDKKGKISFNVNTNHDTNSILDSTKIGATSDRNCQTINKVIINVITLTGYCLENKINCIDILKIDTQGSELAVLQGAETLLKEKKIKLIYCETYYKQQYVDQPLLFSIAQYLAKFGYYIQDMYDPFYSEQFLLWCDTIFLPEKK